MSERSQNGPPQVGAQIQVELADMAYGGDAVGRDPGSGMAVFAWPGIAGEEASVAVTARRANLLNGLVSDVTRPSPLRVSPPCPYFGACGGCQWQHISYEGQVRFKHEILRNQLTRFGGLSSLDAVLRDPLPSPRDYGYRNTSHFAVDSQARSLGYMKRDSHTVITVAECPISNSGINRAIPPVNQILAEAPDPSFLDAHPRGVMRVWHVTIRHSEDTGQTLVVFHTRTSGGARPRRQRGGQRSHLPARPEVGPSFEPDRATSAAVPLFRREVRRDLVRLFGGDDHAEPFALTAVEVMDDGTVNLLGVTRAAASLATDAVAESMTGSLLNARDGGGVSVGPPLGSWVETLGGRNYWVPPEAFFQANTGAANLLMAEVLAAVPANPGLVVDAHAGVGTLGLAVAGRAGQVLLFESSNAAVAGGRWTASASNVHNVEFRAGTAETLLPQLRPTEKPDLILLDPPRAGCHPALLAEIKRREIPRVIYVSCDPSTLARDIKILSESYDLLSARMVDMFPQTFHLETVCVLQRRA